MPVSISRLKDLQELTDFVVGKCSGSGINGLKELNSLRGAIAISGLENVTSGDEASEAKLKEKKHLKSLTLKWGSTTEDSQKERDVLENLEPHTNLEILHIQNYGGTRFPNWLGDKSFCNMVRLCLDKCKNFFSLPPLGQMPSLESLEINDCPEIETFPEGGLPSGLTDLSIRGCEKLKSLPEQMHTLLPSLESLCLSGCPEIESFPEGGLPSKLYFLEISNCKKLVGGRRDWGLQALTSLTLFVLLSESEDVLESFPEEGLLPPTLTHISFGDMWDLKSLNGRALQLLGSLEYMDICNCPQLQSLSVERLPTSLSALKILGCPLLEPRCRREEGEDWHKIAHIRSIRIDGKVIRETISYSHPGEERNFPTSLFGFQFLGFGSLLTGSKPLEAYTAMQVGILLSISACRITKSQSWLLSEKSFWSGCIEWLLKAGGSWVAKIV
ncbi:putative disease resistance protein At3g14460 [Rhododendron vialii]|uniref:putative disease resistance protein At3g14460 n=1 Tax=Rhododendron vialii TaxID=182163 RepID=UPI00265E90DB|nr:putative disease resistance protein At3g14460 [Rhododendron vialii]